MLNTLTVLGYLFAHTHAHKTRLPLSTTKSHQTIELRWKHVPPGAQSLAVIVTEKNHSLNTQNDCVIYNLPIDATHIQLQAHLQINPNHVAFNHLTETAFQNHAPIEITVYALDERFSKNQIISDDSFIKKMMDHVVAEGRLVLPAQG